MNSPTLLSLGSINADFQVRIDQRVGSRETLLAHDLRQLAGGKASNTAWLGAVFGHRSQLLGRVGMDGLAKQALAPLQAAGVDITAVGREQDQPTGLSMIMVPPDAKKHIVLATNANDCWSEAAVAAMVKRIERTATPAYLVVDYEIPAWVVRQAVEMACRRHMPVVLDPSFPDRVEHDLLACLLAITPNASEAQALTGLDIRALDDAAEAACRLRRAGARMACLKLGDGGCVLDGGQGVFHLPPGQVKPTDTTGAGDAFTGVLAVALMEGCDPLEAAAWGVAAANLAVTRYGSKPAYSTRREVVGMAAERLREVRCLDG